MTTQQEKRLSDLEAKTDRKPEEEEVRVALLTLDEAEEKADAARVAEPVSAGVATAEEAVKTAVQALADAEAKVVPAV